MGVWKLLIQAKVCRMDIEIDSNYLNKIIAYFIEVHDREPCSFIPLRLIVNNNNYAKYITHVKYYIETRSNEFPEVYFTDNYLNIYIGYTKKDFENMFINKIIISEELKHRAMLIY